MRTNNSIYHMANRIYTKMFDVDKMIKTNVICIHSVIYSTSWKIENIPTIFSCNYEMYQTK